VGLVSKIPKADEAIAFNLTEPHPSVSRGSWPEELPLEDDFGEGKVQRATTVEPARKDMLRTSNLIKTIEAIARKTSYKDTCFPRVALSLFEIVASGPLS
jgi:hypothetical protein